MGFKIEFANKENTPWAGILLLIKMLNKLQFDNSCGNLEFQSAHCYLISYDNFGLKINPTSYVENENKIQNQ